MDIAKNARPTHLQNLMIDVNHAMIKRGNSASDFLGETMRKEIIFNCSVVKEACFFLSNNIYKIQTVKKLHLGRHIFKKVLEMHILLCTRLSLLKIGYLINESWLNIVDK